MTKYRRTKTENGRKFINLGKEPCEKWIEILPTLPDGWKILEDATTAPIGFIWVWNGKSRFNGKEYRAALVSEEVL